MARNGTRGVSIFRQPTTRSVGFAFTSIRISVTWRLGTFARATFAIVNALKNKLTAGPKREKLAPRTVRSVFALLRLLFRSAVIDEHITTSPVMVEKGVLPKNVDKDPAWRPTAIFEREELIALISHPRIASYRPSAMP